MMNNEDEPHTENTAKIIYGGFWLRTAAILLDTLISAPFLIIMHYINSLDKNFYFITFLPFWALSTFYFLYLPIKYGGTPGKLLLKLKIVKTDGQPIGLKEGILRMLVTFGLGLFGAAIVFFSIPKADSEVFKQLSWFKQSAYLDIFSNGWHSIYNTVNSIWLIASAIVLLADKKKRAIHDFMAGTVVIKNV